MIKCIVGKKGSGKTKQLIDMVNAAVKEENGNVICIEKGAKLTYDISHDARLIDISEYPVTGYEAFIGFLCGIYACDYDVSCVFIDSLYKVAGSDSAAEIETFFEKLELLYKSKGIKFVITISADISELPDAVKKYI